MNDFYIGGVVHLANFYSNIANTVLLAVRLEAPVVPPSLQRALSPRIRTTAHIEPTLQRTCVSPHPSFSLPIYVQVFYMAILPSGLLVALAGLV